jgi:siroheme decarboxylase
MDSLDRAILNEIQADFPLAGRPYKILGERLGIGEDEVMSRISALRESGIIRRIGASINSRKIGFVSTLLAARVPADKVTFFADIVNSYYGVTHNYLRKHEYNVWFTLIAASEDEKRRIISEMSDRTGIEILELPAKRIFKIRVDFKF